jgi:hypothetical protein
MTTASPIDPNSRWTLAWRVLFLLAAAYLLLFVYFYPPIHGIEDESGYINQAFVWQHSSITSDGAGYDRLADFENYGGRNVSFRNPGRALTLLPFLSVLGARSIFFSSALIHLLTVLGAALLLTRLGKSPLWAVLILFHPTLALYSRTVMSDELSGLLLLLAVLAVTNRSMQGLLAGLALSGAVVTRYHAAVVVPFFLIVLLKDKGLRQAFMCAVVTGLCAVGIVAYNYLTLGNLTGGYTNKVTFGVQFLPFNLKFYLPALLLLWPLQLLAPAFDRSRLQWYFRACVLPVFGLLTLYFYHESGESLVQTLVLGQRLLLTILPLWIVSYAYTIDSLLWPLAEKFTPRPLRLAGVATCCCALLLGVAVLFREHQRHLAELKNSVAEIERVVPPGGLLVANRNLTKIFGTPAIGVTRYEWLVYQFLDVPLDHSARLAAEQKEWYLAVLPRRPGEELPDTLREYVTKYHLVKLPTDNPKLLLYRAPAQTSVMPPR